MRYFKKKFIEEIISAKESNVETIINRRMAQLAENNVNNDLLDLLLTTMIYSFQELLDEGSLSSEVRKNMTIAIKAFKNIQHEITSRKGK